MKDLITIGTIIHDLGANPTRLGIVVDIRKNCFSISHLQDFLSFPQEHRFHTLSYDDIFEYEIVGKLPQTHITVQHLVGQYQWSN